MIETGRRRFFMHSLDELIAALRESVGRRSFRAADLPTLSVDQLSRLVPAIMDASKVTAEEGSIVVKCASGRADVLFRTGSIEEGVWCRIDGKSTLGQIAESLRTE